MSKEYYVFSRISQPCEIRKLKSSNEKVLNQEKKIRSCEIGKVDTNVIEKVVMVVGETGAGKTTMVNKIVNYILGVKWDDKHRYKLIPDKDEIETASATAKSQTKWITTYRFSSSTTNLGYNLTLIDTPGFMNTDCKDGKNHRDAEITDQISALFSSDTCAMKHINAVAFVVQASKLRLGFQFLQVINSVMRLFGKDILGNIVVFITFVDSKGKPKVVNALEEADVRYNAHFRFNNSSLYDGITNNDEDIEDDSGDEEVNIPKEFWNRGDKQLNKFLSSLVEIEPKSIEQSANVLQEREHLTTTLEGLPHIIQTNIILINRLGAEMKILQEIQSEVVGSSDVYIVDVEYIQKENLKNEYAVVCDFCQHTCHYPCSHWTVTTCSVMNYLSCSVCYHGLEHHFQRKYRYVRKTRSETKTEAALNERYYKAIAEQRKSKVSLIELEDELMEAKAKLDDCMTKVRKCLSRLREIALNPDTKSVHEYLQELIDKQAKDRQGEWQARIDYLEELLRRTSRN